MKNNHLLSFTYFLTFLPLQSIPNPMQNQPFCIKRPYIAENDQISLIFRLYSSILQILEYILSKAESCYGDSMHSKNDLVKIHTGLISDLS